MQKAQPPNTAKQRRQSLVDTQVPAKCAMHLLQQKLAKSTTRWNDKKLWRGLSKVVIIHQLGTVDIVYNKSGVTGLSMSNNMLKLVGHTRGQSEWQPKRQLRHILEKWKLQNQGSALSSFYTREQLIKNRAMYHHGPSHEYPNSANSEWQGGHQTNWVATKLQASHQWDQGLILPRGWPEPQDTM